ncbi:MAG: hypothetical protein GY820_35935 [Gammaproteobacteria bacterium]|nr:hypothetical protein [Gammaproteobacteria bacterium]
MPSKHSERTRSSTIKAKKGINCKWEREFCGFDLKIFLEKIENGELSFRP